MGGGGVTRGGGGSGQGGGAMRVGDVRHQRTSGGSIEARETEVRARRTRRRR